MRTRLPLVVAVLTGSVTGATPPPRQDPAAQVRAEVEAVVRWRKPPFPEAVDESCALVSLTKDPRVPRFVALKTGGDGRLEWRHSVAKGTRIPARFQLVRGLRTRQDVAAFRRDPGSRDWRVVDCDLTEGLTSARVGPLARAGSRVLAWGRIVDQDGQPFTGRTTVFLEVEEEDVAGGEPRRRWTDPGYALILAIDEHDGAFALQAGPAPAQEARPTRFKILTPARYRSQENWITARPYPADASMPLAVRMIHPAMFDVRVWHPAATNLPRIAVELVPERDNLSLLGTRVVDHKATFRSIPPARYTLRVLDADLSVPLVERAGLNFGIGEERSLHGSQALDVSAGLRPVRIVVLDADGKVLGPGKASVFRVHPRRPRYGLEAWRPDPDGTFTSLVTSEGIQLLVTAPGQAPLWVPKLERDEVLRLPRAVQVRIELRGDGVGAVPASGIDVVAEPVGPVPECLRRQWDERWSAYLARIDRGLDVEPAEQDPLGLLVLRGLWTRDRKSSITVPGAGRYRFELVLRRKGARSVSLGPAREVEVLGGAHDDVAELELTREVLHGAERAPRR
ncbi:MAG: hypothetical protein R3F30_02510 [Planctomycetota bacterium]